LPDQFELFGEQQPWISMGMAFQIAVPKPPRVQITNSAGDRMIQVQSNRFHYNWQKRDLNYPSYKTVKSEFDASFSRFKQFAKEAEIGDVLPNQWELTYVDQIPQGDLWKSPSDWHTVLPGLFSEKTKLGQTQFEGVNGEWHYIIEPQRGRVHIAIHLARVANPSLTEVIHMQTTARGPVRQEIGWDVDSGLELGHDAVLTTFREISSPEALQAWGLTEG
jgi:uncharacterized protein (TIGR04255 family)